MGVYDGFQFLRRAKTRIIFRDTTPLNARIIYSLDSDFKYDIEISSKASVEEQIKSSIHEFLHCGDDFLSYLGKMRSLPKEDYDRVEDEIKRQTEFIYKYHKRLVDFLRVKLNDRCLYDHGRRYYVL